VGEQVVHCRRPGPGGAADCVPCPDGAADVPAIKPLLSHQEILARFRLPGLRAASAGSSAPTPPASGTRPAAARPDPLGRQRRDHLIAVIGDAEVADGSAQVTDVTSGFTGSANVARFRRCSGSSTVRHRRSDC
jgi:hypothetical protein